MQPLGCPRAQVWQGCMPSLSWPTATPGKVATHRGPLAEQEHLLSLYNR